MKRLKNYLISQITNAILPALNRKLDEIKIINAKSLIQERYEDVNNLEKVEFKVFSQFGDDGIIQFLINKLEIQNKTFIEFGVENYHEANTRFLLINNNWSGLVLDGSESNIEQIKRQEIYWKNDLIAKRAFVTSENINSLIEDKFRGDIGILHIDIDGNDYWVWDSITCVSPDIAIIEYNSLFGYERAITIPYHKEFNRTEAHYSNLYFGASLKALNLLAKEKGYYFIGCNQAGNNAYFLKEIYAAIIKPVEIEKGYVLSKFKESRDVEGKLNFIRGDSRLEVIRGLPVFNVENNQVENL